MKKNKDFHMLQEAYTKVYLKEEEDRDEYRSREYDEGRARNTYSREDYDFEFDHELNGKMYHFTVTLDYEVEDIKHDWLWHELEVHKISWQNPETGESGDIIYQQNDQLFDQIEKVAKEKFQSDSDNWVY